ncbi:MAG: dihydrodipicolinate synthase family protein [Devosia sp.]|nr:dihydrodipicolinate synthase family protein [Devosia sp.]
MSFAVSGVNCAAATPLNADLTPDLGLFVTHCRHLLDLGCHGIALLGTTGEANSFSLAERRQILEATLRAGIAPDLLLPGTGVNAAPETAELTRHALANGVTRVVMLPPSYYKGVSDEGLFAAYARIIESIGDDRLKIVLYHIPQVSGVPLSHALIARLIEAFPTTVIGIKDSAGDLANMQAIAAAHPGFAVLAGADPLMLPLLKSGGAGCITATSNLVANSLRTIFDHLGDETVVEPAQARINAWRSVSNSYVQIPTIKAMIGLQSGIPGWSRVRPPLLPLGDAQFSDLRDKFALLP